MLTSHGDLAIAELAFFCPAFLLALVVNFKQGFSSLSWIYLVLLPILQIIGASCTLDLELGTYSSGVEKASVIISAIGTAPLLLALLGFLERINKNMMQSKGIPRITFHITHAIAVAALALAIVGGVMESGTNPSSRSTGKDCLEAGSILFAAVYLAVAVSAIISALKRSYVLQQDNKLMIAGVCVLPFLLVKIAYTVAIAFSSKGSSFYFLAPSVWPQAFMNFAMIAISISFYIWAGLLSPKNLAEASRGPETGYTGK